MAIVPSGVPPWVRTNDLTHYGGHPNKENYLSRGSIDPLTDVDASQFSRLASDVAALQRVAQFCTLTILCNDSVPAAPTVEYVHMQTGVTAISYAGDDPPDGFPSAERVSNGVVDITFDSSYTDPYNVSGAFSITHLIPGLISTSAGEAIAERVSSTVVRLRAFNSAGSAVSNARMTLSVW
jgi:hypothetical protein